MRIKIFDRPSGKYLIQREMDASWDTVVSCLSQLNNDRDRFNPITANEDDINSLVEHRELLDNSKRIIETALRNINGLLDIGKTGTTKDVAMEVDEPEESSKEDEVDVADDVEMEEEGLKQEPVEVKEETQEESEEEQAKEEAPVSPVKVAEPVQTHAKGAGKGLGKGKGPSQIKGGRSFYKSPYNPCEPVVVGSEVAFKPHTRDAEWIQCEVTKVVSEMKFEVRDPEPDENNPHGQSFKANWKDIILIPPEGEALKNFPVYSRVLARYPETTTFYPAEVTGFRRDGSCRLRFEGEEEVDKETAVERRLVLTYPK